MPPGSPLYHESSLLQVGSLEEADRKIDGLAESGQLNPALLLTMAKAYSAAKDTNITKEEVKEIMGHLYFKARPACLAYSQGLALWVWSTPAADCANSLAWCSFRMLHSVYLCTSMYGLAIGVCDCAGHITLLSVNNLVQAKESFAKMQPPEVRILKHLLTIDSPAQRAEEMRNAFTPGPEIETEKQDYLNT